MPKLTLRRSLSSMRASLGLSLSPFNHGERTPGQVPQRDPAYAVAPEVMKLATAAAVPEAQLLLRHSAPVFRANDVAKGLGLDRQTEKRLGSMVRDAAHGAVNEAVFRQDLMGRLYSQAGLEPERRRAVFQRALMFWRTTDGGSARRQTLRKGRKTELPVSAVREQASTKLGIPQHKLPQRGRADPVTQVMGDSKRAIPPGSVRVHYSKTRGGYVRAEKLPDGTWKILGKVHDKDGGSDKKKDAHPELHPKDEHPSSPPPGKEPVHTRDGKPYRRHPNPPMTVGKAVVDSHGEAAAGAEMKKMEREELFKAIKDFQVPADDVSKGESMEGMPSPGGAGGTMQKLDSSGHEKDPEQQLKPGNPEGHELGNGAGSGDANGLGNAKQGSEGLAKGSEGDEAPAETVAKGDPRANYPVAMPTARGTQWTQGPDARVAYSSVADERIAKAMEDGTLSPELGAPSSSPLYGLNKCGNCATGFSKALTVCPDCGTDRLAGTNVAGPRVQLAKSVSQRLMPPAAGDLHFED